MVSPVGDRSCIRFPALSRDRDDRRIASGPAVRLEAS
jgi:hypothetical protein